MAQFCALSPVSSGSLRREASPSAGHHGLFLSKISTNKNPASMGGSQMLRLLQLSWLREAQHPFLLRPFRRKVDGHQTLPCEGFGLAAFHDRINDARR